MRQGDLFKERAVIGSLCGRPIGAHHPHAPKEQAVGSSCKHLIASLTVALGISWSVDHSNAFQNTAEHAHPGGLISDCKTDNTAILRKLISESNGITSVRVINSTLGRCFLFRDTVNIPSNIEIVGENTPVLKFVSDTPAPLFRISNSNHVTISGIEVTTPSASSARPVIHVNNSSDIRLENLTLRRFQGEVSINYSKNIYIDGLKAYDGLRHAVSFNYSSFSHVKDCVVRDLTGFGIIIQRESHNVSVSDCRTEKNGIELVGITENAHDNTIESNYAANTGDNGISISGFNNVVRNNIARDNAGNGIGIYGEGNLVYHNVVAGNAKAATKNPGGWNAGINVTPAFGGSGQRNIIRANECEAGADASQQFCVYLSRTFYTPWSPNKLFKMGRYAASNGSLYRVGSTGYSGSRPPDWTEGTRSDGALDWTFIRGLGGSGPVADRNLIEQNVSRSSGVTPYFDDSRASNNQMLDNTPPSQAKP